MPACRVGCCPDNTCDCSNDCECLLSGCLGFQNPILFGADDLKKNKETLSFLLKICPCKAEGGWTMYKQTIEDQGGGVKKQSLNMNSMHDKCSKSLEPVDGNGVVLNGFRTDVVTERSDYSNQEQGNCLEKADSSVDSVKSMSDRDYCDSKVSWVNVDNRLDGTIDGRLSQKDDEAVADDRISLQNGFFKNEDCRKDWSNKLDEMQNGHCHEENIIPVANYKTVAGNLSSHNKESRRTGSIEVDSSKQEHCHIYDFDSLEGQKQDSITPGEKCAHKSQKASTGSSSRENNEKNCFTEIDKMQDGHYRENDGEFVDGQKNASNACSKDRRDKKSRQNNSEECLLEEGFPAFKDNKLDIEKNSSCKDLGKPFKSAIVALKTVSSDGELPKNLELTFGKHAVESLEKKALVGQYLRRKSCPLLDEDGKPRMARRMSGERRPSCFQHSSPSLGGLRDPDPHHGHDHHHVHEYHHEGGHHHHETHHHSDLHLGHVHHHGDQPPNDHGHQNDCHRHCNDHHQDEHCPDDVHHYNHNHDGDHHHGDCHHDNNNYSGLHVDNLSCCESICDLKSCCEDPNCEARDPSTSSHEELMLLVKPDQVNVDIDVLPTQTTKLRVQNLCCPKESRIVHDELLKLVGVENIRVNVIGRVVHVTHHPAVVSPTELMVTLNKRHLGVSIVDTGAKEEADKGFPKSLMFDLASLSVQTVLLGIALVGLFTSTDWYMWFAIAEICFGVMPVLKKSVYAVRNRDIDLNILITITVVGTLAIEEWIEGAAVVYVFAVAGFLQQFCFYRVHKTISSLMLSKPSKAVMACTGECIPIEKVPIGSIIAVRQGELIPLDGIVVKGSASVDESSISGEAAPVEKTLDSLTFSGTVIQHGYLEIETTAPASSSTISKISAMVEDAQMNVSPTEIMVNKFTKFYTPLVVGVAVLIFLFPLFLGLAGVTPFEDRIKVWGERALIVLVTACPCALLMATPTAVICGINGAARLGALIKGGTFLEALGQLAFLAFDKTGTLTEGKFQVVDVLPVEKANESNVLRWAAALESKSSHPLAAAVVSEYTGECISDFDADAEELVLPEVSEFRTMEGQGISGIVEGHQIDIGNQSLLEKLGVTLSPKFGAAYISYCSDSKTVVFVCVDRELALMISLADIIRWESRTALTWLQDLGVHLTMLTGDSKQTAIAVQKELKIDSFIAEMTPDDKLNWISDVKAEQIRSGCLRRRHPRVVGMVGDGVNDGPALAAANVGIAMAAGGSALAVDAAGVALMTNSVLKVPEIICLSRFCRRIILQNIALAVVLKLVFVVIALTGFVHVWMAVLADVVGLLAVILNGLRPLRWHPPKSRVKKTGLQPKPSWRRKRPILQYESVV